MKKAYIGLDVHKAKTVIGVIKNDGDAYIHGKCSSDIRVFMKSLRKLLKKEGWTKDEVEICYEAGPCGFPMARHLLRMGYDCDVIAPSSIPSKSGDKVKTDRRDAKKLARYLRSGDLTAVHIPDAEDEVIRDLCRARTDAVDDRTRTKQRLTAFLLRNGHHYTGRSNWTAAHHRYLGELVLIDPIQKLILEEYVQALDNCMSRVASIEDHMSIRLNDWNRRSFVESIQGLKGFQMVASMVIASELGDLTRFSHPRKLMAYLGLVASENSTGTRRRQGGITKCGNSHARWILVEVVHSYRYPPKISMQLSVRQEGLSGAIKTISWKAQKRLHKRYLRLKMRGVHENKIMVALARELSSFIWDIAQIIQKPPLASKENGQVAA
jgi:transposase